jgi:hypothetical protein
MDAKLLVSVDDMPSTITCTGTLPDSGTSSGAESRACTEPLACTRAVVYRAAVGQHHSLHAG